MEQDERWKGKERKEKKIRVKKRLMVIQTVINAFAKLQNSIKSDYN